MLSFTNASGTSASSTPGRSLHRRRDFQRGAAQDGGRRGHHRHHDLRGRGISRRCIRSRGERRRSHSRLRTVAPWSMIPQSGMCGSQARGHWPSSLSSAWRCLTIRRQRTTGGPSRSMLGAGSSPRADRSRTSCSRILIWTGSGLCKKKTGSGVEGATLRSLRNKERDREVAENLRHRNTPLRVHGSARYEVSQSPRFAVLRPQ